MEILNNVELLQLGSLAIIFIFFIDKVFIYLNKRKNGNNIDVQLAVLNNKLDNHIEHIVKDIKGIRKDLENFCNKLDQTKKRVDQNEKEIIKLNK